MKTIQIHAHLALRFVLYYLFSYWMRSVLNCQILNLKKKKQSFEENQAHESPDAAHY